MNSAYDLHLYPTKAQPQLHIDNLYTTAWLEGYMPPPVETATVLEVGCGTGLNLLPMAAMLPGTEFVGVDYAERPIQIAKGLAERMGVRNVRFHHADICELADDFGRFDYILAHGFYSWVPEAAREALWRVTAGSLSPQGVLQVSYNALPGWRQNEWLRDFCRYHTRAIASQEARLQEAWALIGRIAAMASADNPYATAAENTLKKGLAVVRHDELAEINQPYFLHEVVDLAAKAGLTYVGDAVRKFVPGLQRLEEGQRILNDYARTDAARRQQYEDFLAVRGFRQSVFTRATAPRVNGPLRERLLACSVTSPLDVSAAGEGGIRVFEAPNSMVGFHSANRILARLFERIGSARPAPVPLAGLLEATVASLGSMPEGEVDDFWEVVEEITMDGLLQVYSWKRPIPQSVPSHPAMVGIARWEALLELPMTSVFHRSEPFPDAMHRALAVLCDGSRTVPEICATLASILLNDGRKSSAALEIDGIRVALAGTRALEGQGEVLKDPESTRNFLLQTVPVELERFRQAGLLG